ncbi:eukaryotic translation initiation factor 2 subunit beta [Gregarina niphandrodes]|uniref:Eukaryotic translation initiation factor 2 subunit beta n=1 Tax=Gregarina niphandrodes TaxID=110365 RepID=A0A023B026_GRENI|nr:eukaryotic translation initiation factor 2 subunit beta [Gregarina niphandrodes]EZG44924.1 eukaryotic translation initiation factor 2 subunit beta [Gregarina niphandrodes]|eukprot:XP_011132623.1 eukaryotic translation initiation factor 2 subunit beta [Gregarina niphandrodes]
MSNDGDDVVKTGEDAKMTSDLKTSDPKATSLFGQKKKKKSQHKSEDKDKDIATESFVDGSGQMFVPGKVYPYEFLLERVHTMITQHNPDLQASRRYVIKPPQVGRVGSRRVAWTNFQELCDTMKRSYDHVCQFVLSELGTEGSISGDGQLVLKGRYGTKHIESLLRKYITEYVTCSMCRSPQTTVERDPRTRLYTISCAACGANRSVTAIKSGFHAATRADRRKAKAAL